MSAVEKALAVNTANKKALAELGKTVPVRKIVIKPRGKDGLFIQPRIPENKRADRELEENHHREGFANHFKFADPFTGNTRTYDEEGRYNCGRCNMVYETDECLLVRIKKVNPNAGSCWDWENQCAGDPELKLLEKSIASAGYGIAANGLGFGCFRCPYASAAYEPIAEDAIITAERVTSELSAQRVVPSMAHPRSVADRRAIILNLHCRITTMTATRATAQWR